MSEGLLIVGWILIPILGIFLYPLTSWALGRWYQGRLIAALDVKEKQQGKMMQNESVLTTSSRMTNFSAPSSTLLHVSICVGPSTGQMFFMWIKSIFGGRLHSYDVILDYGRREVLQRLYEQAKELNCSSMVNVRIETSTVSFAKNKESRTSSVEFLAFATGLRS